MPFAEQHEVKGVCPESDPEPRKRVKGGGADTLQVGASNTDTCVKDECVVRPPGVTDSIECCGGCGATRLRGRLLGDELPEYLRTTPQGSPGNGPLSGMGAGLAMKRGNARGVKAPTLLQSWKQKHRRYTGSGSSDGN